MVVMHLLPSNCINWQCFVPQFEYYFLTFHFSWAAWFPLLLVKFHDLSSFQSWTMCCVDVYISQLPLLVTNSTVWKYMQNPITNACNFGAEFSWIWWVKHKIGQRCIVSALTYVPFNSCCTLCFSHRKLAHTTFSPRIKGLASGTGMTECTLRQFFHFDMPPYLVILLL